MESIKRDMTRKRRPGRREKHGVLKEFRVLKEPVTETQGNTDVHVTCRTSCLIGKVFSLHFLQSWASVDGT